MNAIPGFTLANLGETAVVFCKQLQLTAAFCPGPERKVE